MLIATLSPHTSFRKMIVSNPVIGGLRFNTITPKGNKTRKQILEDLLLLCGEKMFWIDLKARQLRIIEWANPSFSEVKLSHKISVDLPTTLYFKDHQSQIVEIVDGNRLILENPPMHAVGNGEPVNILDTSLIIEGFLTASDCEYIKAAKELGIHNYMLSFVEKTNDISEVVKLDPEASIVAKIESRRGITFVENEYPLLSSVRLMAARDDLYINMGNQKEDIIAAQETIIKNDPTAIVASRILTSLESGNKISLSDFSDLHLLHLMRYRHFMLSDYMCSNMKIFGEVIRAFQQYQKQYQRW